MIVQQIFLGPVVQRFMLQEMLGLASSNCLAQESKREKNIALGQGFSAHGCICSFAPILVCALVHFKTIQKNHRLERALYSMCTGKKCAKIWSFLRCKIDRE